MKKLLLFLLLFSYALVHAQIVNIPDANFKSLLLRSYSHVLRDLQGNSMTLDLNGDNEIQITEALNVSEINIGYTFGGNHVVNSLVGIEEFRNLRKLDFSFNDNNVSELDISSLVLLEELKCPGNNLTYLDVSNLPNLRILNCAVNDIETLILDGLTNLESLTCYINPIGTLQMSDLVNLKFLSCSSCDLTSIDLSNQISLERLECPSNEFTFLDLSACPLLQYVKASNCLELEYINLKNGGLLTSPLLCNFTGCPNLSYMCVDEGEEALLLQYYQSINRSPVNLNSYCSFVPGGSYNTITGTLTFDSGNNGCDSIDTAMLYLGVQLNDGSSTESSHTSDGTFNFYTQTGTFTLTPNFENDYFTANEETVTFATVDNSTIIQNFCITANGIHSDAEVTVTPLRIPMPGFDAEYQITYKNKGNQTLSGNVSISYDDTVLDYVSASTAPSSSATGSLTWSYDNLLPFETRTINVTLNANGPMEIPAVNINDVFNLTAAITPTTGDETPTDNVFALTQTVVGSYDPNDITCLEGATVSPDKIGEYLHYNINFENTGTAPATFIAVKDVIDTTKYDISTLQVLYASHPMEARVTGNKAEFYFDDIQLPGEGKGNVTFKIKTLETLTVNSSVTQQADIFFDYNWPIVTNEATTTFAILSMGDFSKDNSVTVSPNPSNGIVNISAKAEIKSVQLYDVQGRLLQAASGTTIDVSNRAAGLYFVKVITAKGMKVEKLIKE